MKKQYWCYMNQVRFAIYYMDLCADKAHKIDTCVNVVCAIASSGSIAAWALWKLWPCVWAFILAASHVINATKPFLPYNARLKKIEAFQKDMKHLYNKMEYNWFLVASSELTEQQINDLLHQFQNEYIEIEGNSLKQDVLLHKSKMQKRAQELTNSYFKIHFDYDGFDE